MAFKRTRVMENKERKMRKMPTTKSDRILMISQV